MPEDSPYPTEILTDPGFEQMVANVCTRPSMHIGRADFWSVVAYIDGFNAARGGGPLLGFREWLVVKANAGNNLHWAALLKLLIDPWQEVEREEAYWIEVVGRQIAEYLAYRKRYGITKVYYDYGRWLLRKRWYDGPLRKQV